MKRPEMTYLGQDGNRAVSCSHQGSSLEGPIESRGCESARVRVCESAGVRVRVRV
jgi:hypothetical protein